ncbi:hypothetical protein EC991_006734 [Linnemannia zychae]|nr:hypothetical protein EC991_006734 [Linnemannia zychae]
MLPFFNASLLSILFLGSSLALSSALALTIPQSAIVFPGLQLISYPAPLPPSSSLTQTVTPRVDDTKEPPVFQVTKLQLEGILSQALQLDFHLQVVSDLANNKNKMNIKDAAPECKVLGEIPVQVKIHKFRIGGLSAPRLSSQTLNEQRDPVNYGNIRV